MLFYHCRLKERINSTSYLYFQKFSEVKKMMNVPLMYWLSLGQKLITSISQGKAIKSLKIRAILTFLNRYHVIILVSLSFVIFYSTLWKGA